jgi:MHS family proline/betaine transporter-like MFS transporter
VSRTVLTERERRRNRLFTTSGVVIEWYDFMVYGLLATTLQKVFYPTDDATVGLILTFATFAVGYIARPIGGLVIGRLGDTKGRRYALVLSTTLMLIPLAITTILPTYDQIGILAPILLTLMRLMQGFSVGGEYSGALTALSESAGQQGRGRSVSLGLATAMGGNLLASLVVFATTVIWGQEALVEGTWRIPYAVGFVLAIVAVLMLRKMRETESFELAAQAGDTGAPVRYLVKAYPGATCLMLALATWSGVTVYTLISWMPSYLETVVGITDARADLVSALISVIYIGLIIPVAVLGDRRGRRPLMVGAVIAYVVLAIPSILLLNSGVVAGVLLAIVVLAAIQTFVDSTTTTEMTQLVPTKVRYTGLALTYSIGMIIGSFTPAFEESLLGSTGSVLVPAFVLIGVSLLLIPVIAVFPRYVTRAQAEDVETTVG